MITIDSGIVFDFPASWQCFKQGKQLVFQSPKRDEVIISKGCFICKRGIKERRAGDEK